MTGPNRRRLLQRTLAMAGALALGAGALRVAAQPRVLALTARRFVFEPEQLALTAGEAVVVEIRSLDFVHGLSIPALGLRMDLLPGRVNRLELPPQPPGVIDFLCDNFCGDGHEQMHGRFVVRA